jgi:hypothetical protein
MRSYVQQTQIIMEWKCFSLMRSDAVSIWYQFETTFFCGNLSVFCDNLTLFRDNLSFSRDKLSFFSDKLHVPFFSDCND